MDDDSIAHDAVDDPVRLERGLTVRLDAETIIATRLARLAHGLPGDVEPVGEGVSELRIDHGPGCRVYFQRRGDVLIVLLCGGDKKTQGRDIAMAEKPAKEWSSIQ